METSNTPKQRNTNNQPAMSHWKEYKLGEIGKIITGTTPPTKNPENYGNFLGCTTNFLIV
jgi:hypothetical protein